MKKIIIIILLIPMLFSSCYEDIDNTKKLKEVIEITEIYVNTKISGSVHDLEGHKISNYSLLINGQEYNIEQENFIFTVKNAKQRGQTIFVKKNENIVGLTTAFLVENDINQIDISLINDWNTTVSNSNQNHLALDCIDLLFTNNSFINEQQQSYSGQLNFITSTISEENNITNIAYTPELDVLVVEALGGFFINIQDNNNSQLSINKDHHIQATLKSIPEEATALLYFDAKNEHWTKIIDLDTGISNFPLLNTGYYVYAKATTGIFATGDVNYEGTPISYQTIQWSNELFNIPYTTTLHAKWLTLLPENNTSIKLHLTNQCGDYIYTETINTEDNNIDKQNISIENQNDDFTQVNLEIIDCDGNIIENPSLVINDNINYNFEGATINTWVSTGCGNVTIAAQTDNNNTSGPAIPWTSSTAESLNILSNCESLEDGFSYIKIDNEVKLYDSFELSIQDGRTILSSQTGNIKIFIKGQSSGIFDETEVNIYINDKNFGNKGYFINCDQSTLGCGITECIISQYNNEGLTTVKISGNIWVQDLSTNEANTLPIEGTLIIKE